MKISELFDEEPNQWGSRCDPYLWRELKSQLNNIDVPDTPKQLQGIIEEKYHQCTGHLVSYSESFRVERFSGHGMSSGMVSPSFWVNTGIPLLVSRHEKL